MKAGLQAGKSIRAAIKKSLTFGSKASARHRRRANSQAPCGRAPL
jgi:hypothetical protein